MASNHHQPSPTARTGPPQPGPWPTTVAAPVSPRQVNQLMLDLVHRTEFLDPEELELLARYLQTLYKIADPSRAVEQVATG